MMQVLTPAEKLVRSRGRGKLLSILEKEVLVTGFRVLPDGRFLAETRDWGSYWKPLRDLGFPEADESLNGLHTAWRDYIVSRFDSSLRRDFCFRYFCLLGHLLSNYTSETDFRVWTTALQTALGFECFQITSASADVGGLAAGTCTLRNPCYQLAKLRFPNALDDPQFLPLITVAGQHKPELFYHYRQYILAQDSPLSLLLYPIISETNRAASFKLINSLASAVGDYIDPRTRPRAKRLFEGVVRHIIKAPKGAGAEPFALEFVDMGAGSGSLAASLCRQIRAQGRAMAFNPRIRVWFIDLEPSDPARFFRAKEVRGLVDSLMFLGDDYRDWLSRPQPLPATRDLRIALVSKLFNNLSRFSIRRVFPEELAPAIGSKTEALDRMQRSPTRALAPGGRGAEALSVSNARVSLHDGRTFAQLSLSRFFQGLLALFSPENSLLSPDENMFLPVRLFNPECLVTRDGASVIGRLLEICDYVLIEDADLTPKDLEEHMARFLLDSVLVRDVSKVLGLTGNNAYVISPGPQGEGPDFPGERIW